MDLDLWDCFGRKKLCLIIEEIPYMISVCHRENCQHANEKRTLLFVQKTDRNFNYPVQINNKIFELSLPNAENMLNQHVRSVPLVKWFNQ